MATGRDTQHGWTPKSLGRYPERPRETDQLVKRTAIIATLDEPLAARIHARLAEEGLHPTVVQSGDAAIGMIEASSPAIVVTDLSLPGADGFQVVRALRSRTPPERCGVVVISAFGELRAHASLQRETLGISAVLPSIVSESHLDQFLRRAIPLAGQTSDEGPPDDGGARERARLAEIARLGIVNGRPPVKALQQFLSDTARKMGAGTALITIVTADRQYFKAYHGIEGKLLADRGTPHEESFCRHLVSADKHVPLVVPDTTQSPLFADNPLVRAGIVGSYVGAPLVSPEGHVLGSLCIIDRGRWMGSPAQVQALVALADKVVRDLVALADFERSQGGRATG